jgi:hypothetical protein
LIDGEPGVVEGAQMVQGHARGVAVADGTAVTVGVDGAEVAVAVGAGGPVVVNTTSTQ